MGRVVKGARLRAERYALDVPEIAPPLLDEPTSEMLGVSDEYGFFGAAFDEVSAPSTPQVDVAAIEAQAQALLDDAARNAEALLNDAHERARAMIEDAAVRAEAIAADARSKAHDEGFAAGRQQADVEMHDMVATLRGLIETARVERHKVIESAEPELVRLALGIAERVLHQQIALDRGVVVEMAKTAIARLIERDTVTVRVNPADLERMREHRDELIAIGDIRNLRVVEDKRVDRGGVVVETEAGTIDARIGTQLEEARKVLHIEEDLVVEPAPFAEAHPAGLPTARAS
ncbi:MAG TPA: FliH/SctL family protein [Candidatus Limnocylindria bacterium]|jgi:flagellar assembly protein FliH|nr:FliH/SctL family protein [Candidatus Limnocylindria bacterium]